MYFVHKTTPGLLNIYITQRYEWRRLRFIIGARKMKFQQSLMYWHWKTHHMVVFKMRFRFMI